MDAESATTPDDTREPGQLDAGTQSPRFLPTKKFQRIGMEAQLAVLKYDADGFSTREIAKVTGIAHQRISEIVAKHNPTKDQVRQVLNAQRVKAAEAWGRAIPKAAKKGDHRPARELLIATGDVTPLDTAGSGVTVVVNMPGAEPQMGAKVVGSASIIDSPFQLPSSQVVE